MTKKELKKYIIIFVAAYLILSVIVVIFQPEIWYSCTDIDLNSGRIRDRVVICWIPVKTEIRPTDSDLSGLIGSYLEPGEPDWYQDIREVKCFPMICSGGYLTAACHEFAVTLEILQMEEVLDEQTQQELLKQFAEYFQKGDWGDINLLSRDISKKYLDLGDTESNNEHPKIQLPIDDYIIGM